MLNRKNIALGASTAAVALGVSLGATGMAWATTTPAPSASSSAVAGTSSDSGSTGERMKDGRGGHGLRGVHVADLAAKLGVDETSVSDALQAARDAAMATSGTETGEKPDREAMEASLAVSLADSLGLKQAAVQTAIDELKAEKEAERAAALQERLNAAVTDGSLTQAEADGAAKAVELGLIGGGKRS